MLNISKDPVKHCAYHKRHSCVHVDGILCDINDCITLKEYEIRKLEQQLDIPYKDRMK